LQLCGNVQECRPCPARISAGLSFSRPSSSTDIGRDNDSEKWQRPAITTLAKAHGHVIIEFYDAAVSGGEAIAQRRGFKAMLDRIAGNAIRCIVVESPDRFARDLTVQLRARLKARTCLSNTALGS
jgi:DNA invertase Pin-like site-specific DNA recombinase